MDRRSFAGAALAGGVSLLAMAEHARAEIISPSGWLNVREFGAKGDGRSLDTEAIQRVIDAAAKTKGTVFFPPGMYLSAELRLRPNVALVGVPTWDYRGAGGTVVRLADERSTCLMNITNAWGATIDGLALDGQHLGKGIHGVFLNKPDYGEQEDTFRIERCQVMRFTGDGVNLTRAWCFSIRHSMLAYNYGDGLRLQGWDGFILDNWLSSNGGAGFGARLENASVTMTANRIEWNHEGVLIRGGNGYNITGNFFDGAGASSIALLDLDGTPCSQMTITGNYLRTSGQKADPSKHESSHLRIEGAEGITCVGNALLSGTDREFKLSGVVDDLYPKVQVRAPSHGIVYKNLRNCVIVNNVLHKGAGKELLVDLGGHGDGVIVRDNPGCLVTTNT